MARHDQVRLNESTTGRRQAAKDGDGRGERWVRHHVERSPRQPQVGDVGADDFDATLRKTYPQFIDPLWMQLEREHGRSRANEWTCQCASSRTQIEHEIAPSNSGVIN